MYVQSVADHLVLGFKLPSVLSGSWDWDKQYGCSRRRDSGQMAGWLSFLLTRPWSMKCKHILLSAWSCVRMRRRSASGAGERRNGLTEPFSLSMCLLSFTACSFTPSKALSDKDFTVSVTYQPFFYFSRRYLKADIWGRYWGNRIDWDLISLSCS